MRDPLEQFLSHAVSHIWDHEAHYQKIAFELYSEGLATWKISFVMEKINGDSYSKGKISRILKCFYQDLEACEIAL